MGKTRRPSSERDEDSRVAFPTRPIHDKNESGVDDAGLMEIYGLSLVISSPSLETCDSER